MHTSKVVLIGLGLVLLVGCGPSAEQKALISEIEQKSSALEQEALKLDGNQTYLKKEQNEYNEKNKDLKKKLGGKNDSLFNALTRAHQKVVDDYESKLKKLKDIVDASKDLVIKLKDPVSFTFDKRLIEADFKGHTEEGKPIDGYEQKSEKLVKELKELMEKHETIEEQIKRYTAQLDSLEKAKLEAPVAVAAQKPAAKVPKKQK